VSGRSHEIAAALDGDARCFYDFGIVDRKLVPIRYLLSAIRTVLYLLRVRPRAVIASNPPIFPGLIAYLYGRVTGAKVVLDSHPSSFALDETSKVANLTQPLTRFLVPRVQLTMVTVDRLAEIVREQGGRAEIVHEATPPWKLPAARPLGERPKVLLVNIFAADEPFDVVVEAARQLPGVDFLITGDLRKCPPELQESRPENVTFTGFLDQRRYLEAMAEANVVMTLTERPEDVSRAACEAIFARRPLIVSDWPAARRYFPHAIGVENTPGQVAAGVRDALERYDELREESEVARRELQERWQRQLQTLRETVDAR
jgi:glycosyltransferase involved in cell wall biosynthesis